MLINLQVGLLGACAPNKKGAPKGELTLRTSVITHGSKGELALRGTFFIWCTRALLYQSCVQADI